MALVETGVDFQLSSNTTLGVAYQGQFGSGVAQNSLHANFNVKL
ncbi:autotransporter outer membrane beta-barrel domain-containing protein [Bradyrhizobium sp. ORS 86]